MSLIERRVEIKRGWHKGDWGVVKMFDGQYYHVAIFGDENECLIFERDEIRVPRNRKV